MGGSSWVVLVVFSPGQHSGSAVGVSGGEGRGRRRPRLVDGPSVSAIAQVDCDSVWVVWLN